MVATDSSWWRNVSPRLRERMDWSQAGVRGVCGGDRLSEACEAGGESWCPMEKAIPMNEYQKYLSAVVAQLKRIVWRDVSSGSLSLRDLIDAIIIAIFAVAAGVAIVYLARMKLGI